MKAVVLAIMLAANAAYALGVPHVLDGVIPAPMPHGLRESSSPTTDARASFVDITAQTGILHKRAGWEGDFPYAAVISGGVAATDLEGDGDVDLYFTAGGPGTPAALYRNEGAWTFTEVAAEWGLAEEGWGAGAAFADADNDGDPDLALAGWEGARILFQEDGRYVEVYRTPACDARPCQASSVVWLDADADGQLDLYVVNNLDWRAPGLHASGKDYASLIYFAPQQASLLLRNAGGGIFEDVTQAAGVPNTGKGLAAVAADLDGDGRTDLATANDITENALYLNAGGLRFDNRARERGANEIKTSMGIAAGDLDGDGDADLVVSNFRGQKLSLLVQDAGGRFRHETDERGVGASWRGTGWGVALTDVDLDGWLDVLHAVGRAVPLEPHRYDLPNVVFPELLEDAEDQLFRNLGGGRFAEATYHAGAFPGATNTRAILAADLDGDGDEDVVRVNVQGQAAEILRNDLGVPHASLTLRLRGEDSNRDGIGARVEATLPDGRVLVREHLSSAGYQTGLAPDLVVGLGEAAEARVIVRWPSGAVDDYGPIPAGRHTLVEGAGR